MTTENKATVITVEATINAPIGKVWKYWTEAEHVKHWNNASEDWHTPKAENDLRVGGSFTYRMEAKDGSFGFDFGGVYSEVKQHERIDYKMADDRKVENTFKGDDTSTHVVIHFDAETQNPVEMQKGGWQAILNNFKTYTESH
jgi:uncharacterized protein YndB with AHSA1/START domain